MTVIEENAKPEIQRREEKLKENLFPNNAFLPLQNGGSRSHEPYIVCGLNCPWTNSTGMWQAHRWWLTLLPTAGTHLAACARQSPAQSLTQTLNLFPEQPWHLGKNCRRIFTVTWFWMAQLFRSGVFGVKSSYRWWMWGLIHHQELCCVMHLCIQITYWSVLNVSSAITMVVCDLFPLETWLRTNSSSEAMEAMAVFPEGSLTGWWETIYKPITAAGFLLHYSFL